jgi:hypothetical protein
MIHPEITVTLTLDDVKLYDRAREIGLPSIVVSMYGDRIKKLLAEERSTEREACAKVADEWSKRQDDVGGYIARNIRARGEQA